MNPIAACYLERGIAHFRQNQFDHAIAAFDVALQIDPSNHYARWNRATALLSLGDYARGFVEHDVAWRLFHWRGFSTIGDTGRLNHLPVWCGESDCRVLVYHELGFGDAIMAMRFLPALYGCAVTLVIDQSLVRLALTNFAVEVESKIPDDLSDYDYRLPFFGVMSALGETGTTIPAAPYLARGANAPPADRKASEISVCKTARGANAPRIGIAWSGRTQTGFTLGQFLSLLRTDHQLCALQPGDTVDGVEPLPAGSDFADVAARIAQMDHIVSVDTAAIHLAGAMGHPSAHLLLPFLMDWRWWRTALWYPALKTYRQENATDDWRVPFGRVNAALARV